MKNIKLKNIIFAGLLVAIGIILSSLLSISYPPNSTIIKFGIGYLPLIIISIILGPKIGLYSAIIQDVLGYFVYMWIFGVPSGPFYLGFTFNAILYGVIPGIIYNLKLSKIKIFNYLNLALLTTLIILGIYAFVNIQDIIASVTPRLSPNDSFSPLVVYSMLIIGELGLIGTFVFIILKRHESDSTHRIIFSIIILQIIISLILTPLWVSNLYKIPFWPQIPLRIIKTPIEIFLYSILLIRSVNVLQSYVYKSA